MIALCPFLFEFDNHRAPPAIVWTVTLIFAQVAQGGAMSKKRDRMTVELTDDGRKLLTEVRRKTLARSDSEAVRKGLQTLSWLVGIHASGFKVRVVSADGNESKDVEILMLF